MKQKQKIQIIIASLGVAGAILSGVLPMVFSSGAQSASVQINVSQKSKSAMIMLHSIELARTKANGKKWDIDGPPDIKADIQNLTSGQKVSTNVIKNSFDATFNMQTIRACEDDTIQIIVYDVDIAQDDVAGKATMQITKDMICKKSVDWHFDQVLSLQMELQQ
jgi:hypothetical protein